jgi:hypothetical protein
VRTEINLLKLIDEWDSRVKFSEDAFYSYFESAGKFRNMYENIRNLYQYKWSVNRSFPAGLTPTVERWLDNFSTNREQRIAFELVSKVLFYSRRELECLCRATCNNLLAVMGQILGGRINLSFIDTDAFLIPATDSDAEYCTFLRHSLRLNTNTVKQSIHELKTYHYARRKHIILLEDFVGSGTTAINKYREFGLREKRKAYGDLHFYYCALTATAWGLERIRRNTGFEVVAGEVLDSRYRCFSDNSIIYPQRQNRAEARQVFGEYGEQLCKNDPEIPGYPLGFNDDQLSVVLPDNTPDNTLPVIWYPDKNWFALFKRDRRYHGAATSV